MKIALGCDHGGYELKEFIKTVLDRLGHTYEDFGCFSTESCDYPDFGAAAARAVADGKFVTGHACGSSFDFGLKIVEALRGREAVEIINERIFYHR